MSIFNDKALKGVADAVSKIMDEELKGNQTKIDANNNGKVDAQDFKLLRAKKSMKEEKAKMDYDKDGKVESPKAEVLGSRIRAAKMAGNLKEDDVGYQDRYSVKNGKATVHNPAKGEKDEPHHVWADNAEHAVRKHAAKTNAPMKESLDEAFPTVADGEKSLRAKEGKTSSGTVTKTKTGLVHKRDYKDDDNDSDDTQKKSKGYGARQNMGKRGQSDGTKKTMKESKLSFTEMLELYNEAGVEVISKIVPQTVKFGDTEVELIDANIVNGAVGITVAEEVDNETFTKEVEAQKAKNAGGGKKAEVAKASVQAVKQEEVELDEAKKMEYDQKKVYHLQYVVGVLEDAKKQFTKLKDTAEVIAVIDKAINVVAKEYTKHLNALSAGRGQDDNFKVAEMISKLKFKKSKKTNEEVEQIDEISSDLAGKYLTAPQGKGANKYKTGEGKSSYPSYEAMSKHGKSVKRALQRADTSSLNKKPSYYKEEEQLDEKLPASASAGDYIHDFVHSDNPKFAGKSTKERQKMALGAFYAKNKGK